MLDLDLYEEILEQIPQLRQARIIAPFIGPNYGSDPKCKILIIVENAVLPTTSSKNAIGFPNPFNQNRTKIEQTIKSISSNKTTQDAAYYYFILRPFKTSLEKPTPHDLDESIEAFVKAIDIFKPTHVLFYGNECFRTVSRRSYSKALDKVSIERFLEKKKIHFFTISRRSDFQPKSSSVSNEDNNQKQKSKINELLNQAEKIITTTGITAAITSAPSKAVINAISLGTTFAVKSKQPAIGSISKTVAPIAIGAAVGITVLELIKKIRAILNDKDENDLNKNSFNDFGMAQKTEFIISLALENQKNNTTITFSQLAEKLNNAGIRTARGEKFSTDGKGPFLLLNKVFKNSILVHHDAKIALAIATTFIYEKTGLPWIFNEITEKLVENRIAFYEDGVLKASSTHKPITQHDIPLDFFKETPLNTVDNRTKYILIDHLINIQNNLKTPNT